MLYRFTLAAVVAATTLTGCAAFKSASGTAPVSTATQAADTPAAAAPPAQPVQPEQSAQTEQPAQAEQPVQTQPITAPGAVTESAPAPVAEPAHAETQTSAAPATADAAPEAPAATAATSTPAAASAASPEAPVKEEKISAAESTKAVAPFSSGPTQIDVSHIVTRADDGSSITLTIDGTEAGILKRGEKRAVFVEPGTHKVGGYVQTLFGLGRVTIPPVEITTTPGKVKNVSYSVTRTRPAFTEAKDSTSTPG
ncbi:hypothetical protein ABEH87_03650 [Erwinia sp. Eh17-17]|jgi:hypothetical protein|uniref:hypothetical protein n=1 Tax=Erwinia sp. Eh17-17 TaxID=3080330 RepID=UPI00320893BC